MNPQVHATVGLVLLVASFVVGMWALQVSRMGHLASRALGIATYACLVVLTLQILLGLDLWLRLSAVPATGIRGTVHIAGPILALIIGLSLVFGTEEGRARAQRYTITALLVFTAALVSYGIGEMG